MERIIINRPGSFDRLQLVQEPDPAPGSGEVLVRTCSIGVNFADCVVRLGLYPSATKYVGWPITPGFEFSGVVDSVGSEATRFKPGDQVFGVTRFGGYSSAICVPEAQLFPAPRGVSLEVAGAVPVASLTAWYALVQLGAAQSGKRVLVHSAAGGVGSTAVQMAVTLGCEVTGVVGTGEKVSSVRALGVRHVIDKSAQDWAAAAREAQPGGYDVVLDANGVETLAKSYGLLRPTGRLVVYGAHTMLEKGSGSRNWLKLAWRYLRTPRFDPLKMTNENRSVMAFNLSYLFEEAHLLVPAMEQIIEWLESGSLRFSRLTEYPLKEASRAHMDLQSGNTIGKLALVPTHPPALKGATDSHDLT